MKPSICIIGPAHPLRGGLATFNERLARQFIQEGHDTEIFTFSLQYPSFLFPGTSQYSTEPAPNDLKITECINSISPINWLSVGYKLMKRKPDIIVVRFWIPFMGPCLGTILRLVSQNKHTRIICIADNIIPHEKRFGDKQFTTYFLKPVNAFITMSSKVLSDLKLFNQKPALQIKHPLYDNFGEQVDINLAKDFLHIDRNKSVVLFFGFIRKYKGLDLLFEAIGILKQGHFFEKNNVMFVVAGEFYDNQQPYLELIDQLNISEYILLKNEFITDSEVKYYLSAADMVIQPYKSATQSGVTPLAYHFEKPMIVTNVGGLPDLVPTAIGLVAEPNAISIANTIIEFFKLDSSELVQNIRKEKLKYSWDKVTQSILELSNTTTKE
ncbi:MAG TPA: glycosyltransferase [Chitinophagaceae bacterium]|nr:glycosyltransferase [Chitinophagaceae bacterium]